jgi:uncharacterized membrane protein
MCAIAYFILQNAILHHHGKDFALRKAIGKGLKGKLSVAIYILGLALSFYYSWAAILCYIIVAMVWFIPDKRIEKNI